MAVSENMRVKVKRWAYAALLVLLILFLFSLFYFAMGVWMLALVSDIITGTSVTWNHTATSPINQSAVVDSMLSF